MTRGRLARVALAVTACAGFGLPASLANADSFTPVRLSVTISPIARLRSPLKVTVSVSADPGLLDGSEGQMRVGVKLAGECGGDFDTTPGDTLLNKPLSPQPTTGKAYSGTVSGSGKPSAYGVQTVCVFLGDADVGRLYGNDESQTVDVSQPCTVAARTYDSATNALQRSQRRLRHTKGRAARRRLQRTITTRKRTASKDRSRALKACGTQVAL